MPDPKYTRTQFAKKIKQKYPEYKDVDDSVLAEKMLTKYPEYQSSIVNDGAGGGFDRFKRWLTNLYYWFSLFPKY